MSNEITKITQIEEKANRQVAIANSMTIATPKHYLSAAEFLKTLKSLQAEVGATFDPIVEKAYAAHKEATQQRRKHLDPLISAEGLVKRKMLFFKKEQDRKQQEEEAKRRKEAEEAAGKEKKRLEAEAKKEEKKGNVETAESLRVQKDTVFAPEPIVKTRTPPAPGITTKVIWKHRVISVDKVPRKYMIPNETILANLARATKGSLQIPGVKFYPEEQMASGKAG